MACSRQRDDRSRAAADAKRLASSKGIRRMAFMSLATQFWRWAAALLGVLLLGSFLVMSALNWGVAELVRTPGSFDGTLSIRPPFKIRAPILQILLRSGSMCL